MQSELLWAQGLWGIPCLVPLGLSVQGLEETGESLAELTSARPPSEHFLPRPRQTGKFIREKGG